METTRGRYGLFIEYCIELGVINIEDVSQSHVRDYLIDCQERGNKPSTINTKIMRIRAFYNYLIEEKVVSENMARKVRLQKEAVKIDVFTDEQIYQMLEKSLGDNIYCVLNLITATGFFLLFVAFKIWKRSVNRDCFRQ